MSDMRFSRASGISRGQYRVSVQMSHVSIGNEFFGAVYVSKRDYSAPFRLGKRSRLRIRPPRIASSTALLNACTAMSKICCSPLARC